MTEANAALLSDSEMVWVLSRATADSEVARVIKRAVTEATEERRAAQAAPAPPPAPDDPQMARCLAQQAPKIERRNTPPVVKPKPAGPSPPIVRAKHTVDFDVARLIGRARKTLQKDRLTGDGIPFIRVGRLVRYRRSDVQALDRHTTDLPVYFRSRAHLRRKRGGVRYGRTETPGSSGGS